MDKYKLVPVEPTVEMSMILAEVMDDYVLRFQTGACVYKRLLDAAPDSDELTALRARVAELRGLCNWAAGRMLDAGDIAGHEEVLRKLGQGT